MFNLYTDKKYLTENDLLIWDADATFDVHVVASEFGDKDLEVMSVIDSAELLDANTGLIKTSFGLTDISNLSTGCKIVLLYLHLVRNRGVYCKRPVLNILECGGNALSKLVRLADTFDSDVALFATSLVGIEDGNNITCIVNDIKIVNDILFARV